MPIQSPIVMQQFCINLPFLIMFFLEIMKYFKPSIVYQITNVPEMFDM